MRRLVVVIVLLIAIPFALRAQVAQRVAAPLRGTVVDSTGNPIENVEISATTVGRLVRTDAVGHFEMDTLVTGPSRLVVRRLGWKAIDTTIYLNQKIPVQIRLVMARVAQSLEEVRIVSHDDCPTKTLEGFDCRRRAGIGAFRDSAELAALQPMCMSNMLVGMEGIRTVGSNGSPCAALESTKGWRCVRTLVDGRPLNTLGQLRMTDYIAIEFYDEEDKIPEWYKSLAYQQGNASRPTTAVRGRATQYRTPAMPGRFCALIVYWTKFADRYNPSLDQDKSATRAMQARRDSLGAEKKAVLDSLIRGTKKP